MASRRSGKKQQCPNLEVWRLKFDVEPAAGAAHMRVWVQTKANPLRGAKRKTSNFKRQIRTQPKKHEFPSALRRPSAPRVLCCDCAVHRAFTGCGDCPGHRETESRPRRV